MSVSDLVAKRMEVQKQILINPADVEAHKALNYIQQQAWFLLMLIVTIVFYMYVLFFLADFYVGRVPSDSRTVHGTAEDHPTIQGGSQHWLPGMGQEGMESVVSHENYIQRD